MSNYPSAIGSRLSGPQSGQLKSVEGDLFFREGAVLRPCYPPFPKLQVFPTTVLARPGHDLAIPSGLHNPGHQYLPL